MKTKSGELTVRCEGQHPLISELSRVADVARDFSIPADARIESIELDNQVWAGHGLKYCDVVIGWRRDEVAP